MLLNIVYIILMMSLILLTRKNHLHDSGQRRDNHYYGIPAAVLLTTATHCHLLDLPNIIFSGAILVLFFQILFPGLSCGLGDNCSVRPLLRSSVRPFYKWLSKVPPDTISRRL